MLTLFPVPFDRGLGRPQGQSGYYEEGKKQTTILWSSCPDPGIDFNIIYSMEMRVRAAGS
jgi:hypothetical protein